MNYAVAIYSVSKSENQIFVVEGNSPAEAMKEAIIQEREEDERNEEFLAWVKSLGTTENQVKMNAEESDLILSHAEEL